MSRPLLPHTALRWVMQKRTCSLQAGAHLRSHVCHLPTGLGTAPTLISAGSQLGIGTSAYLITGNCALVAHISANSADGWGDGGTPFGVNLRKLYINN